MTVIEKRKHKNSSVRINAELQRDISFPFLSISFETTKNLISSSPFSAGDYKHAVASGVNYKIANTCCLLSLAHVLFLGPFQHPQMQHGRKSIRVICVIRDYPRISFENTGSYSEKLTERRRGQGGHSVDKPGSCKSCQSVFKLLR